MLKRTFRSPFAWAGVTLLGIVTAFGLYWFQPWKLVTETRVDDALPPVAVTTNPVPGASGTATAGPSSAPPPANRVTAAGVFITHEHATTGRAEVIRQPDGRNLLVLHDLDTSNGPDLRVWLTDQRVVAGTAGWRLFDDGEWFEVARLKGNRGDQVYELPPSIDPTAFRSVSIWCKRFAVSFGAAELKAT
ncbi:electron transfer DM13 [Micromonospora pisi]|uniref:Electron transfer DM13 n=1 Tax=Micromonospora pisi TaxID=589240 RepID=A0A495JBV7_9ACTN|nr:DM13 domain-containing protein [Micromonospora pisi]RKR86476.1 electron transfer DM13 [Micromonospora pisi]